MKAKSPARALLPLALCVPLVAPLGCELVESASSPVIVAGLLVKAPELKVEGFLDIPAETAASVWLGERESATSTEEPKPLTGANVQLTYAGNTVQLRERMEALGLYVETSVENPGLTYATGAAYSFNAELPENPGISYGGTIRMAPEALTPAAMTLEPSPTELRPDLADAGVHAKGAALKLSWGRQYGRYAFVSVWRGQPSTPQEPELLFDNRPKNAGEFLKLIASAPPTTLTIPGETFAEDGVYAVVLAAMNKGDDLLPSTFIGSPILAGTSAVALLVVGTP